MITLLVFIFGGLGGMLRGVSLLPSTTLARFVFWNIPIGILIGLLTWNIAYGLVASLLAWAGIVIGYWGSFDLTKQLNRNISNYLKLTATACFRMLPLAIGAALIGHYYAVFGVFAGITFVPAYLIGIKIYPSQFTRVGDFIFYATISTVFYIGF